MIRTRTTIARTTRIVTSMTTAPSEGAQPIANGFLLLTGAGLDPAHHLLVLAFGDIAVVVGHLTPGLLDLALELVPAPVPLLLPSVVHVAAFPSRCRCESHRWGVRTRISVVRIPRADAVRIRLSHEFPHPLLKSVTKTHMGTLAACRRLARGCTARGCWSR